MKRIARVVALVVLAFVCMGAGAVLAYWTLTVSYDCTHCAVATASTLSAPKVSASAAGAGRVDVSWTMPKATPAGVTFEVTRTGGLGGAVVRTVTDTSLSDTTLTGGTTYGYSVVALLGTNWRSVAGTASASTPTTSFVLVLSSTSTTAGSSLSVTSITARVSGSTDTTYSGSHVIAWSGLAASPAGTTASYPGTGGAVTQTVWFTNGVATLGSSFTPVAAGSATLTATEDPVTGSTTVTVTAAAAARIGLTGGGNVNAGAKITLTCTVQDTYGNAVTSGSTASTSITFTKASGTGTVSGMPGSSVGANNGVATITLTANLDGPLVVQASTSSLGTSTQTVTVVGYASANKMSFTGGGTVNAGSTLTLTATVLDNYGNTVTGGPAATTSFTFSRTSGTGTVSGLPGSAVSAVAGVAAVTVTGNLDGSLVIRATGSSYGNADQTVTVSGSAAASKVTLTGGGSVAAGATITLTATVQDAYGNTVSTGPGATTAVSLAKTAGTGTASGWPASTTSATAGVLTVTLTGNLAGSLTAEAAASGLTSSTQTVTVTGYSAAAKVTVTGSITARTFTATIQDTFGNTVTSGSDASKAVTFSATGTGTVTGLPATLNASNGVATTTTKVNPVAPGSITITAAVTIGAGAVTGTLTDTVVLDLVSAPSCSNSTHKCTFAGGGSNSAGGTITVTVCQVNTWPCASPVTTASVAATSGTWTTAASGTLTAGTTYYARVTQDANTGPTTATFQAQ